MRDMEWKIPVECAIISGSSEYTCISADMNATEVTYYFNSSASPDAIVFYPGDMPDSRTVIDVGEGAAASNPQPSYGKPEKLSLDAFISEFNRFLDVITSYSIHYTKLYETWQISTCSIMAIPLKTVWRRYWN